MGEVVNAGEPPLHQTCSVIFPVLVAERAEPASAVIMPFMGIADGDPTFGESPELPDESVIELLCPLSVKNATMSVRPLMNSERFRQRLFGVRLATPSRDHESSIRLLRGEPFASRFQD